MIRRLLSLAWKIAVVVVLIPVILVPLYTAVTPVSTLMLWRWATGERVVREWRPLEAIAPELVRAVIVGEDARFCAHRGVDWGELREALEEVDDLADARGASTIAMQTAKNLFLWPGRQYLRKALEVPIAYYINLVWSKRRIIEVYLNTADWGPNGEFGAEAGARRAFRKSARALTAGEAALLAAVLPNPARRDAARPGRMLSGIAARRLTVTMRNGTAAAACVYAAR